MCSLCATCLPSRTHILCGKQCVRPSGVIHRITRRPSRAASRRSPEERKAGSAGVCGAVFTAAQMSPGWPLGDHDTGHTQGVASSWRPVTRCLLACGRALQTCLVAESRHGRGPALWYPGASRRQDAGQRPPQARSGVMAFSFSGHRISTREDKVLETESGDGRITMRMYLMPQK